MTDTPAATTDALTPEQIRAMSPDTASETLAAMQAKYLTDHPSHKLSPEAAAAKLKELSNRPTDADGKAIPLPVGPLSHEEVAKQNEAAGKDYLETLNFPERGTPEGDDLWNMIEGRSPVSLELQKAAERKLSTFQRDGEWRRRLLDGDQRTMREFHLATGIVAAGKRQHPQG